jgi:hypothetical protein
MTHSASEGALSCCTAIRKLLSSLVVRPSIRDASPDRGPSHVYGLSVLLCPSLQRWHMRMPALQALFTRVGEWAGWVWWVGSLSLGLFGLLRGRAAESPVPGRRLPPHRKVELSPDRLAGDGALRGPPSIGERIDEDQAVAGHP